MEIKLTKQQVEVVLQLLNNASIAGRDAEFIVELKKVFIEALSGDKI